MSTQLELIASKTCPFAQRVAIMLHEKKLDFVTTYVDLQNKPDWFLKISPLGKIPVLRVDDQVLFESAAINEYLDEAHLPRLHPENLIQRAINRAWVELGSDLMMAAVYLVRSPDAEQFATQKQTWLQKLARVESDLKDSPFFNGEYFSLVDIAFAPLFVRLDTLQKNSRFKFLENSPNVQAWAEHLIHRKTVQAALAPDYTEALLTGIRKMSPYFATQYF